MQHFNEAHSLPGAEIVLQCNDSRGDAKETVNIAGKLVDNPAVLASVSDFTSTATMAAADTYARGGLLEITPSASHPQLVSLNKWMFRASETVPSYVDPIADFITEKLGKKRVAVIQVQTDWGQSVGDTFAARLKHDGGTVSDTEIYNQGTTDFRSILTKLRRERPEVIFLAMLEEEAATFMRQYKQLGMTDIPVVDSGVGITDRSIQLSQGAMDGIYSLAPVQPGIQGPRRPGIHQRLPRQIRPRARHLVRLWLGRRLSADGRHEARLARRTRAKVRDELAGTGHFNGANGELSIDPDTREVTRYGLTPVRVQGGKLTYGAT